MRILQVFRTPVGGLFRHVRDLARREKIALLPFLLESIAQDRQAFQTDGLHPTAEGVDVVVERILPTVEAFLKDRAAQLSKPSGG